MILKKSTPFADFSPDGWPRNRRRFSVIVRSRRELESAGDSLRLGLCAANRYARGIHQSSGLRGRSERPLADQA